MQIVEPTSKFKNHADATEQATYPFGMPYLFLVLLIGVCISASSAFIASRIENSFHQEQFERAEAFSFKALNLEVKRRLRLIQSVGQFISSHPNPNKIEFERFVSSILASESALLGVEWFPIPNSAHAAGHISIRRANSQYNNPLIEDKVQEVLQTNESHGELQGSIELHSSELYTIITPVFDARDPNKKIGALSFHFDSSVLRSELLGYFNSSEVELDFVLPLTDAAPDTGRHVDSKPHQHFTGLWWNIEARPTKEFQDHMRSWFPWIIFAGGTFVTLLSTLFLLRWRQDQLQAIRREQRSQIMGSIAHVGSWEWHKETQIVSWDEGLAQIYGLGSREAHLNSDSLFSLIHEEDRERVRAERTALMAGVAESYESMFRIVRSDGEVRFIKSYGHAERNAHNQTLRVMGVSWDITDLMRTEQELLARESHLSLAIEASGGARWQSDLALDRYPRRNRSPKVSAQQKAFIGFKDDEFPGSLACWIARIHADDQNIIRTVLREHIRGQSEAYQCEYRILHKDGSWVWIRSCGKAIRNGSGKISGWVGIDWNITTQKAQAAELQKAKSVAETSSAANGLFLASMSHEIRSPLTSIIGNSELLKNSALDIKNRILAAESVDANARYLLELLNSILDISKLEAGKFSLQISKVTLHSVIDEVVRALRAKAEAKQLQLRVVCDGSTPSYLLTDPTALKSILFNLTDNAIKFTNTGSVTLKIGYDAPEHNIKLEVLDTGPGIAEEDQRELFSAFAQAKTSMFLGHKGSGLGLAITKRLLELLGGTVTLKSTPGAGTVFFVSIPAPIADDTETKNVPLSGEQERDALSLPIAFEDKKSKLRILIVEDCREIQLLLLKFLEPIAESCVIARDGSTALIHAQESHFDLIIMDSHLPVVDGPTATHGLRAMGVVAPILAITADVTQMNINRCLKAGCSAYLSKPFSRLMLLNKIADLTGGVTLETEESTPASNLSTLFCRSFDLSLSLIDRLVRDCNFQALAHASHREAGAAAFVNSELFELLTGLNAAAKEHNKPRCVELLLALKAKGAQLQGELNVAEKTDTEKPRINGE